MRHEPLILTILLAVGALGASPAALADQPLEQSHPFLLGGVHADVEHPSDPVTLVDEERALATATCGLVLPIEPVPAGIPPPPGQSQAEGLGGACFDVTRYAADAELTVSVQRAMYSVPENREHFAVGYDGDDDGCIGCSPADALWRGFGSIQVPVLEDESALMVFVYGASVSTPPYQGGQTVETATLGVITVTQTGTSAVDCGDEPGTPEGGCGIDLGQPRPHVCVPACQPSIDTP